MNASVDRVRLSAAPEQAAHVPASRVDAARVLHVQAAVLAQSGFHAAASALVNELALLFNATRVCLGWVDPSGTTIQAMSGEVDFLRKADVCCTLAAAMDEAMGQGACIAFPGVAGSRPRITLAHAEVARLAGGGVFTVPLVGTGGLLGAVTLELPMREPIAASLLAPCEQLACLVAPVLELKWRLDRPWQQRLGSGLREMRERALAPGQLAPKLGVLAALLLLGALSCWPVDYRVSAPARLEGAVQRVLVAPADGFLRETYVKPGDAVTAGQVLADLAAQDLEIERRKWASERAQLENTYLAALAKGERTQYAVNFGKAEAARAQLDLVEQQIQRSSIRAPFDGVVIKGDLSQSLGAPVQRGDVLLTVAPVNEYRLIVEVDERDIGDVVLGRTGVLALAALPDAVAAFRVVRVTPVATAREGRNFYEVECQFQTVPAGLRPGLQGVAKINAGMQPLGWIWTHRVADWARLALWSLGS